MGKTKDKKSRTTSRRTPPRERQPAQRPVDTGDSSFSVLADGGEVDDWGAEFEGAEGDDLSDDVVLSYEVVPEVRDTSATSPGLRRDAAANLHRVREGGEGGGDEELQSAEAAVGHFLRGELARCAAQGIRPRA